MRSGCTEPADDPRFCRDDMAADRLRASIARHSRASGNPLPAAGPSSGEPRRPAAFRRLVAPTFRSAFCGSPTVLTPPCGVSATWR
jgi:hypothetical protein